MTDLEFEAERAAQREWLRQLLRDIPGSSYTSLAKAARLAPTTLTRFMSQDVRHLLTTTTVSKLTQMREQALANLDKSDASLPASSLPDGGDARHEREKVFLLNIWGRMEEPDRAALMHILEVMGRAIPDKPKRRRQG